MKPRLKVFLKGIGIFLIGIMTGMFLLEALESHLRPAYRDLIRVQLKTEHEFLGSRASRENRFLDAAFHRWVVVNCEAKEGFSILRKENKSIDDTSYLFPFHLYVLKNMSAGDEFNKGKNIAEGIDRGKLAFTLESLGHANEANLQWVKAQELMNRPTLDSAKKTVRLILEQENSDLYIQTENLVLDQMRK